MLHVAFPGWQAAFSGREDGDLRVTARSPEAEDLDAVQRRVLDRLGVEGAVVGRQVHGCAVIVAAEARAGYRVGVAEGDGVATALPGLAAGVHVADCLPIALGGEGGVAMLHGGWRGLDGGIVAEGVRALRTLGVHGPLAAAIGPGVGGCCYETGEEVRDRFARYGAIHGRHLDLRAVAAAQLRESGVERVEDLGLCTMCSPRHFSHRRDGAATGRQAGFAWR